MQLPKYLILVTSLALPVVLTHPPGAVACALLLLTPYSPFGCKPPSWSYIFIKLEHTDGCFSNRSDIPCRDICDGAITCRRIVLGAPSYEGNTNAKHPSAYMQTIPLFHATTHHRNPGADCYRVPLPWAASSSTKTSWQGNHRGPLLAVPSIAWKAHPQDNFGAVTGRSGIWRKGILV